MALQFPTQAAVLPNQGVQTQQAKPKAQVWLNVGTTVQIPNPETGEVEDVFVALPVGIPLDTMDPMEAKGTNKNWANMVQAKNWLLDQVQKAGADIEAGGEQVIDGLQIQLKRVGSAPAPAADENPFLTAMQGNGALSVVK